MKLGINQPYFFPYLGFFSLIKHTDKFILLDIVQFVHQSWMRRNRILKQGKSWDYIHLPVQKCSRDTLIKDVLIDNRQSWKKDILNQLHFYRKTAPNYLAVTRLLNDLLENEFTDIVTFNKASLEIICDYLLIEHDFKVFSKMNLSIAKPAAADEWPINICKAMGNVDEYWNPPGGFTFYDRTKYEKAGLTIRFLKNNLTPYNQANNVFEPGLSIIDVMMFNNIQEIHALLDNTELL